MLQNLKNGRNSIENHPDSESVAVVRIPEDLIREILLYLPVKSLGRFKCVSKPWRSFISSPQFIKSHFSTSLKDGQRFNHQLLFVGKAPNSGMKLCSLSAALQLQLHNPPTDVVSDIEYPCRNPESSIRIVGIVNGLVCLSVGANDLYIWNPILKQSKLLPPPLASSVPVVRSLVQYGFGYDESNDDYKVVQVLRLGRAGVDSNNFYQSIVKVYSLRRNSWRILEGFMDEFPYGYGTYVDGNIFWATFSGFDRGEKWKYVSLDMASDKSEEVQGPCYEIDAYMCKIGSFGGSLSMFFCARSCERKGSKVDLWVMDKNGIEESWSKVFSLPCDLDVPLYLETVVSTFGDGEILLEDARGLMVYRTKTKDFRHIQLDGSYHGFFVYVQSLVAL